MAVHLISFIGNFRDQIVSCRSLEGHSHFFDLLEFAVFEARVIILGLWRLWNFILVKRGVMSNRFVGEPLTLFYDLYWSENFTRLNSLLSIFVLTTKFTDCRSLQYMTKKYFIWLYGGVAFNFVQLMSLYVLNSFHGYSHGVKILLREH